jgi:pyridinium-3,5-bisthiocarboxylic acid mononucleotide nickel chelatase
MRIAYFDCFSGISGDMILGALVDIGVEFGYLKKELKKLNLDDYQLKAYKIKRGQITGTKVDVIADKSARDFRYLKDIETIINKSSLDQRIKKDGLKIFRRIAKAEAKIHNIDIDKVYFHEIGAVDSIIDILGSLIGVYSLNVEKIISSPVNTGRGMIETEHGNLPVPAPATMELLKGIPIYSSSVEFELTTPTGAAIISSLAHEFKDFSSLKAEKVGYGAGSKDLERTPNLLRLIVGESPDNEEEDVITVLEANIDDMNPEFYDHIIEKFFKNGALDVFLTPVIMKKNRPGIKMTVLAEEKKVSGIQEVFFGETSTFGVRFYKAKRKKLEREIRKLKTEFGEIRVKIGKKDGKIINIAPEYEDCKKIAKKRGISLKEVFQKAADSARKVLKLG